jgi:hypothetical protein
MISAGRRSVFTRLILAALLTTAVSTSAAAQSWFDAYAAGDYRTAAAILHPLVLNLADGEIFPEAFATERLALMYAQGLGVRADPILACSLFNMAERAAEMQRPIAQDVESVREALARSARFTQRREDQCSRLREEERREAASILGCFTASFPPHHFELAPAHTVDVKRSGVSVRKGREEQVDSLGIQGCVAEIALVRYTRTEPPASMAVGGPRHFIEVFSWSLRNATGKKTTRTLNWTVREVLGTQVLFRAQEILLEDSTPGWPAPPLSFGLSDVTLQMVPSGEVTWRFDLLGNHHGVIERIPRTRAGVSSTPPKGTGSVQIRVVTQMGAATAGATVRLLGPIAREGTTTQDGTVVFGALPAGRFDIRAFSAAHETMWPSRFVDVADGPVPPFDVTLKRAGPERILLACGFVTPLATTLSAFSEDADAVLHVRVEGQRAFENPSADEFTSIETFIDARVLQAFKAVPGKGGGGAVTIVQPGGAIDRGDVVERLRVNNLDPLSVGDDYVLFLKQDERSGKMRIHFGEEGAFRLRNGRVQPLGAGELASEWKNARAVEFLEELRGVTLGR